MISPIFDVAPGSPLYVSLGDSISIDDYAGGAGCGAASLLFENRADDFPEWAGRDLRTRIPEMEFLPLAWDGGTSDTVRDLQISYLQEHRICPTLVTLTMGGNDLLQVFGNDAAAQIAYDRFRENGEAVLSDLRAIMGPDAPILIGTTYDPSDGDGDPQKVQLIPWPNALLWIRRFNEAAKALASAHGATVIDVYAAFQGHGLAVGDPSQHDPRPANRALFYCGVVEPNAWGAHAIRGLWWQALHEIGYLKP